jgi:ABC-type uncharacterized transport system auxiliary subunit
MRRFQLVALIIVLAWISGGCGAARPVKYYVIDPGPMTANPSAPQYPVTILISRITASHLYREDRLVFGAGDVQFGIHENERWTESPVDMMQDLLLASLRSTGQYAAVARIGSMQRGNYILRGHLNSLYEVDKPALLARFSLELELFDSKAGTTVWTETYSHDEPVNGKSVSDVVEAIDRDVHGGIQQLTASLAQYFASHPPQPAAGK